jgi:CRP-like cAMP-binding protein
MDDRIEALRTVPLFHGLSDKDLEMVLEIAKEVVHHDGHPVVEEDASGVGFHLILSGTAEVTVHGSAVATFGPGDYFGEMSIIDGKPRSATVTPTGGDVTTLAIPAWSFETLMNKHPSIMRALLTQLSSRVRAAESPRS